MLFVQLVRRDASRADLHGGQEQGDEHADDGNDHEQFNEREPSAKMPVHEAASDDEME